ncbi:MAG TPA: ABC transporter ATP-binding protein/permease [Candidatus Onthocola stercoravium]|nr:ABC transporter ATP-binding protein/permease [Candidatus Onthocola stercoravium]
MLKLNNIKKNYETGNESVKALKGINIEFRENEFVSILGPSGCGKTTLLNIIGGLDHYTSGDLIIDGISTKKYKDRDWDTYRNHRIGFVFQNYNLITHQSVLSNVELALTLSGVDKQTRRKKAIEVLEKVGLKDQMYKKPNQMSGGQMQRVAIARALVNDPDILLADEPTGALDTKTSVQIMEILKEISKDRLIIMVTHNPELAQKYSTRIINLLDGEVTSDSKPYSSKKEEEKEKIKEEKRKAKKTSMSFLTAMNLSLNNLMTKKGRTILTAFAGSIGIIGIALILSISNGVQQYINNVEEETLTSYPLTVQEETVEISDLITTLQPDADKEVHEDGKIYSNDVMSEMMATMSAKVQSNNLEAFKSYIESDETNIQDYTSAISYSYNLNLQIYKDDTDEIVQVNPNTVLNELGMSMNEMQSAFVSTDVFSEMFDSEEMNKQMYDLIAGSWPTKYNEVVLVVDENNEISDFTLYALGLKDSDELSEMYQNILDGTPFEVEQTSHDIDDLVGMNFKFILNSDYYDKENGIWVDKRSDEKYMKELLENAEELTITGIIKPNEESVVASTAGGVLYLKDLKEYVINKINESDIAKEQTENPDINVFTGQEFSDEEFDVNSLTPEQLAYLQSLSPTEMAQVIENYEKQAGATYEDVLNQIGVIDLDKPSSINIYPKDFDSKEEIVNIINNYNEKAQEEGHDENVINYSDLVGVMMSGVSTIIDVISYVLMAFVSISLIVSSIMIGIITYISVLERTKEIGILRAIGASKKDISRVFNAETFIEGLIAGVMGILITLLLTIPINIIIKNLSGISNVAILPIGGAIILVIISILLTTIAGLIPSRMASKKDPVEALRVD